MILFNYGAEICFVSVGRVESNFFYCFNKEFALIELRHQFLNLLCLTTQEYSASEDEEIRDSDFGSGIRIQLTIP